MSTFFRDGLQRQVEDHIGAWPGVVGVCVHDLTDGATLKRHAGQVFPAASTIKIRILATMMVLAEEEPLDLSQQILFAHEQGTDGSGFLASLEEPVELSLLDTAVLMIALSNYTATNGCIVQVGMARVQSGEALPVACSMIILIEPVVFDTTPQLILHRMQISAFVVLKDCGSRSQGWLGRGHPPFALCWGQRRQLQSVSDLNGH